MNINGSTPNRDTSKLPENSGNPREERFLSLYNAAYSRVYAYVFSLVPDRNDAFDIMQETSLVLLRRFDDFDAGPDPRNKTSESERFVRWGCGIALNHVRQFRRDRAHTFQFGEQAIERISTAHERYSNLLESRRRFLPGCLERLSKADRELAARCFTRDSSIKAVAEQMNRPVNTLYKAVSRIRRVLKECIDLAVRQEERT
jgi:RNA polymerase sigma-70 factor (ECF subfamily)